jgi:hypothetical protein
MISRQAFKEALKTMLKINENKKNEMKKEVMNELMKMMASRKSIWSLDPSNRLNRLVMEEELKDEIEVAFDTVTRKHGIKIPSATLEGFVAGVFLQVKQNLKMS